MDLEGCTAHTSTAILTQTSFQQSFNFRRTLKDIKSLKVSLLSLTGVTTADSAFILQISQVSVKTDESFILSAAIAFRPTSIVWTQASPLPTTNNQVDDITVTLPSNRNSLSSLDLLLGSTGTAGLTLAPGWSAVWRVIFEYV